MKIEIPDSILTANNWSEKDLLIEMAVFLYVKADYSWANAARFANLSRQEFQKELWKRKISLKYDVNDFEEDLINSKYLLNDSGQ